MNEQAPIRLKGYHRIIDGKPELTMRFNAPDGTQQYVTVRLDVVVEGDAFTESFRETLRQQVEVAAESWLSGMGMEMAEAVKTAGDTS